MGWVYVPIIEASGVWADRVRRLTLHDALVELLLCWRSLDYLELQIGICRWALDNHMGDEQSIHILGEKAADYAQQLLDERYGAVPA